MHTQVFGPAEFRKYKALQALQERAQAGAADSSFFGFLQQQRQRLTPLEQRWPTSPPHPDKGESDTQATARGAVRARAVVDTSGRAR